MFKISPHALVLSLLMQVGSSLSLAPAWAQTSPKPDNLCLTCPRPVPSCWMVLYRWQDYNLKGDWGTTVIATTGNPPTEDEKERERLRLARSYPPTTKLMMSKTSRIACPPGARVE